MGPKLILNEASNLIDDRGVNYGGIEQNFDRAAKIASLKLDKHISPYEVAIVLESVKDARRAVAPEHYDSHIDGINYRAFALLLSGAQRGIPTTQEMAGMINRLNEGETDQRDS
jgi:hypothetical protein